MLWAAKTWTDVSCCQIWASEVKENLFFYESFFQRDPVSFLPCPLWGPLFLGALLVHLGPEITQRTEETRIKTSVCVRRRSLFWWGIILLEVLELRLLPGPPARPPLPETNRFVSIRVFSRWKVRLQPDVTLCPCLPGSPDSPLTPLWPWGQNQPSGRSQQSRNNSWLTFMPGRPECPVRAAGQALGHWKTQQPIWGHGRAPPPGGVAEPEPVLTDFNSTKQQPAAFKMFQVEITFIKKHGCLGRKSKTAAFWEIMKRWKVGVFYSFSKRQSWTHKVWGKFFLLYFHRCTSKYFNHYLVVFRACTTT